MKAAFHQRGFPLLFAGLVTSMIGDSLMLIVLAIWVKGLTGSSGAAGLIMGRVSAATEVLLGIPQSGSIALGALLVTLLSFRSIFWISAVVIFGSAVYLTWALHGDAANDLPQADPADVDVEATRPIGPLTVTTPVDSGE
jgi:hypothetical protein